MSVASPEKGHRMGAASLAPEYTSQEMLEGGSPCLGRWWEAPGGQGPGHEDGTWEVSWCQCCGCVGTKQSSTRESGQVAAVMQGFAEIPTSDKCVPGGDEAALAPVRAGLSSKGAALQRGLQPGMGHLYTWARSTWALGHWAPEYLRIWVPEYLRIWLPGYLNT